MNDFYLQLAALVTGGEIFSVLRSCHRPCQRLLSFDDFCQSVLVRAVEHGESFRGTTSHEMLGWLKAIGQQLLITLLRRSRETQTTTISFEIEDQRTRTPLEQDVSQEECRESTRWLAEALTRLTEEERDLLIRHYYRGQKLSEIADAYGIPRNTVTQRHVRVLKKLRDLRKK